MYTYSTVGYCRRLHVVPLTCVQCGNIFGMTFFCYLLSFLIELLCPHSQQCWLISLSVLKLMFLFLSFFATYFQVGNLGSLLPKLGGPKNRNSHFIFTVLWLYHKYFRLVTRCCKYANSAAMSLRPWLNLTVFGPQMAKKYHWSADPPGSVIVIVMSLLLRGWTLPKFHK